MKKNALFLTLLCLICIKNSYAQHEITSNMYDLSISKIFTLDNMSQKIGIKTSDLYIGTHYQATAKVDMYSINFSYGGWDSEPEYLYLYGFRTVKEPPLPNYTTDYQNISSKKTFRKNIDCDFVESDCHWFDTTKKYDSNDIAIFKKIVLNAAKSLMSLEYDSSIMSLKDMTLKVSVALKKEYIMTKQIKSIRLPGLEEITDLNPFVEKNTLKVYPNPSPNGVFNMSFDIGTGNTIHYIINNSFGETIIDKTLTGIFIGTQTLQITTNTDLNPGIYYLKVVVATKTFTKKLIVSDFEL